MNNHIKYYFVLIIIMGLAGCDSDKKSPVIYDEKDVIDVVSYLPKESMVKNYSEYGFRYHGTSQEIITVDDKKITIDYTQAPSYYRENETFFRKFIEYNDINITTSYVSGLKPDVMPRYVNNQEIIDEYDSIKKDDYICESYTNGCDEGEILGIKTIEKEGNCVYELVDKVGDIEGDFLKYECNGKKYTTIHLNTNYLHNEEFNSEEGKHGSVSKLTKYFKKGIGLYRYHSSHFELNCENNLCKEIANSYGTGRTLLE